MDGLARVAGSGIPIDFDGETLFLDPPSLRDYGALEQHLLTKRPNVIVEATIANRQLAKMAREEAAAVPDGPDAQAIRMQIVTEAREQADAIMNKAMAQVAKVNKISPQEVADFGDCPEGFAFLLWLKLSNRYPNRNFTLKHVTEVCEKMADEDFARMLALRDQAAGTDILGNSTGQLKKTNKAAMDQDTEQVDLSIAPSTGATSSGQPSGKDLTPSGSAT